MSIRLDLYGVFLTDILWDSAQYSWILSNDWSSSALFRDVINLNPPSSRAANQDTGSDVIFQKLRSPDVTHVTGLQENTFESIMTEKNIVNKNIYDY